VVNKYHKALVCGALDPEETLPKFNQELKDAGIETIIAEKQSQLDTWLSEQK
jgi:putative aldouronate transport system substrate-binding protein